MSGLALTVLAVLLVIFIIGYVSKLREIIGIFKTNTGDYNRAMFYVIRYYSIGWAINIVTLFLSMWIIHKFDLNADGFIGNVVIINALLCYVGMWLLGVTALAAMVVWVLRIGER